MCLPLLLEPRGAVDQPGRIESIDMFASLCWIAWKSPIRCPNWRRSMAYPRATSNAACVIPTACAAIPMRPPSRVDIATANPRFSSPSSRSRPTTAPSTTRSTVEDELSPSFSSSRVTRTWSSSSTKADTPRAPVTSTSVRAKRRNVPA